MLIPKTHIALSEAIEEGCQFALNRVLDLVQIQENIDDDRREEIVSRMANEVLNAIYERFTVDGDDE